MKTFFHKNLGGDFALADGALGTTLMLSGHKPPLETLNRDQPELVTALHRQFVAAGSSVVLSNSFLLSPLLLDNLNLPEPEWQSRLGLLPLAVQRARLAFPDLVGLSIAGALPSPDFARDLLFKRLKGFWEQVAQARPDFIALETVVQQHAPLLCVQTKMDSPAHDIPLLVSAATDADAHLLGDGSSLASAFRLWEPLVQGLGWNCTPVSVVSAPILKTLRQDFESFVWLKPSRDSQDLLGQDCATIANRLLPLLREDGFFVLGGCCGTGPEFIAELKRYLSDAQK